MQPYYDDGQIILYCARWEDVLPELTPASFDLVITSPPYNTGLSMGGGKDSGKFYAPSKAGKGARFLAGYGQHNDCLPFPEYEAWQRSFLTTCWPLVAPAGALIYNHKPRVRHKLLWTPLALNPGLPLRQIVVWDRGGAIGVNAWHFAPACEWLLVFADKDFRLASLEASGRGDVWRIPYEMTDYGHPAPFPVALPARALAATGARTVLDPHAGSGSTLRAAMNLGCRAVGVEPNERYCEIAVRRLAQRVLPLAI